MSFFFDNDDSDAFGSQSRTTIREHRETEIPATVSSGQKRTVLSINSYIDKDIRDAVKEEVKHLKSLEIIEDETVPHSVISVTFHMRAMKPMIYVEPEPFDEQFCNNIDSFSIILSSRSNEIQIKALCSYYSLVLLHATPECAKASIKHILAENNIFQEGYKKRSFGATWNNVLQQFPNIRTTFANAIAIRAANRHQFITNYSNVKEITTGNGKRIPEKVFSTIKVFFESRDPDEEIYADSRRKKLDNPKYDD